MRNIKRLVKGVLAIVTTESKDNLEQALYDFLKDDYVPKNYVGCTLYDKVNATNIRQAPEGLRCVQIIGDDLQSGPLYCGETADYIADSIKYPGAFLVLCKKHTKLHGLI